MARSTSEQMAHDDVPFSIIIIVIGVFATHKNWIESDWWGFFGTIVLTAFGVLWLTARIYHLTHKDEVFGNENN